MRMMSLEVLGIIKLFIQYLTGCRKERNKQSKTVLKGTKNENKTNIKENKQTNKKSDE